MGRLYLRGGPGGSWDCGAPGSRAAVRVAQLLRLWALEGAEPGVGGRGLTQPSSPAAGQPGVAVQRPRPGAHLRPLYAEMP
jgi:hypothetical protein